MKITDKINAQCRQLRLPAIAETATKTAHQADKEKITYLEFLSELLATELGLRMEKEKDRRKKNARLPLSYNLDLYDFTCENSMEKQQLKQLRELVWLEQNFNLVLMGPSGTGKTYIAAGLCFDAIDKGYRAYFQTMESLIKVLKMKDMTRKAAAEYKRITSAHLLVIDDIMMFPVTKQDAVAFFNLINQLHDKASLIITTNKSPAEWADVLNDQVLTTAILDRVLHRCEIIKLSGKSYRLQNRKTIFNKENNQT
ncbi:IS21-like element helper ATPase IstB [Algoriphagus sp.]|uniref:IS21-like element helper ATPase IstB n=1 Tax=Algoriphagus sp. TaxID=1872435 RepID=UPI0026266E55|nr:IS21-like element helper ATPase IstB [Algoriphagus sp.]